MPRFKVIHRDNARGNDQIKLLFKKQHHDPAAAPISYARPCKTSTSASSAAPACSAD
jgi:hypothetical protein